MPALLHDSYIMPPHTNPLEIGAVSGIQSLQEVWKKNPWLWVLDLRKDDAINSKFTKLPLHQYVSQSYSRLWLSWFRAKTGLKSVELVEINRVHNRCTLSWQNAHIPDRGSLKCFWQKPFPSSRQWLPRHCLNVACLTHKMKLHPNDLQTVTGTCKVDLNIKFILKTLIDFQKKAPQTSSHTLSTFAADRVEAPFLLSSAKSASNTCLATNPSHFT